MHPLLKFVIRSFKCSSRLLSCMFASLCDGMTKPRIKSSELYSYAIRSGRRSPQIGLCISDYKSAAKHVDILDAAMKQDSNNMHITTTVTIPSAGNDALEPTYFGNAKRALQDKLFLAPLPLMGNGCQKVLSMPLLISWSSYLAVQKEISKNVINEFSLECISSKRNWLGLG